MQSLHALGAIEERRRSGHEEVQPGIAPGVHLVHELTQGVQRALSHITAHALDSLHLVEDENQARLSGIAQHDE